MYKPILLTALLLSASLTNLLAQTKLEKHFFKGEYAEVIELFKKQTENHKADISDYLIAAKCYEQQFDFVSAANCYQKALTFDSANVQTLEGLADANVQLGLKKEALDIYSGLFNADSANIRIAGKYASLFMDVGAYKHAQEIYQRLYAADTNSIYFLRKLITSYYKQEEFQELVPLTQKMISLQPFDVDMRLVLITAYQKADSTLLAIDELNRLLAIDTTNLTAISKLAFLYFTKLQEYDEALVYYKQLNEMENNSDITHLTNLGICEFFAGDTEVAAYLLDSLSDVLPTDAMIPFYAGLSYKRQGKPDLALQFLERSAFLAVPAHVADIYHHLGRAYSAKRMFTEAFKAFEKVREIAPDNYMVLYDIAITHEEFNLNRKTALSYYQQFLDKCPNRSSPEAMYAASRMVTIKEQLFFEGKD